MAFGIAALAVANENRAQSRTITVARFGQVEYHVLRSFLGNTHELSFEFGRMQCIQLFHVGSDDCDLIADFSCELHDQMYAVNIEESRLLVRCQQIKNGHAYRHPIFNSIEDDGMTAVRDRTVISTPRLMGPGCMMVISLSIDQVVPCRAQIPPRILVTLGSTVPHVHLGVRVECAVCSYIAPGQGFIQIMADSTSLMPVFWNQCFWTADAHICTEQLRHKMLLMATRECRMSPTMAMFCPALRSVCHAKRIQ